MAKPKHKIRHTFTKSGRRGKEIRVGRLVFEPRENHLLLVQESAPIGEVSRVQSEQESAQCDPEGHLPKSSTRIEQLAYFDICTAGASCQCTQ